MARDLSFLKMPEKSGDEEMMDAELSDMGGASESGIDLTEITDEELIRECEKRGMKVEMAEEAMPEESEEEMDMVEEEEEEEV